METRFETFTVLIARIGRSIRRIKAEEMARFRLKGPHVSCLYYLSLAGPMTARILAEWGADIIKVFPGELFGPKIIKAFKGPIPQINAMPTGGVSAENVHEWISAGAVAVGAGSSLTGGAKTGEYDKIVKTAKVFLENIRDARAGK